MDAGTRLLLAMTVLEDNGWFLRVDENNKGMGMYPSLKDLVENDVCFAGVPKPTFVALDGDSDESLELALELAEELTEANFSPVVLRSGPDPNRVHLWVRADNENLAALIGERGRQMGFDWRRKSPIRPPFTRHAKGGEMEAVNQSVSDIVEALTEPVDLSAIDDTWFNAQFKPKAAEKKILISVPKKPRYIKTLPSGTSTEILKKIQDKKSLALITQGTLDERCQRIYRTKDGEIDRSRVLQHAAWVCRRDGVTDAEWETLCSDPTLKGFNHLRKYTGYARIRAGKRSWERSEAFHDTLHGQREIARQRALSVRQRAHFEITGRGRETRLLVLQTMLDMAMKWGLDRFRMDMRRLALEAKVTNTTASRAVSFLVRSGFITRLEIGEGRKATLYSIASYSKNVNLPNEFSNTRDGGRDRIVPRMDLGYARRDLFRASWRGKRGLGKTAGFVLAAMDAMGPATAKEVARAMDRKTLSKRILARLKGHGLIVQDGPLWRTVDGLGAALVQAEVNMGLHQAFLVQLQVQRIERWRYLNGEAKPYQLWPGGMIWRKAA